MLDNKAPWWLPKSPPSANERLVKRQSMKHKHKRYYVFEKIGFSYSIGKNVITNFLVDRKINMLMSDQWTPIVKTQ